MCVRAKDRNDLLRGFRRPLHEFGDHAAGEQALSPKRKLVRYREPLLARVYNLRGEHLSGSLLDQPFAVLPVELGPPWQMEGKVEQFVLEKRNPHLHRSRHANAVMAVKDPRQAVMQVVETMREEGPVGLGFDARQEFNQTFGKQFTVSVEGNDSTVESHCTRPRKRSTA